MVYKNLVKIIHWETSPAWVQKIRWKPLRRVIKILLLPRFLIKNIWLLKKGLFILPYIEMPVTTRCTLCCEKCANLMQYYQTPSDIPFNDLIKYMDRLTESVDYIRTFNFLGGEPLLHPHIGQLIEYAVNCKKIGCVKLTTNGTIPIQDDQLLNVLANPKAFVAISDYGKLSLNSDKLTACFDERKIKYIFFHAEGNWYDFGDMEQRCRNQDSLKKQFSVCASGCRSYYKGCIYWCPRAAHGLELNLIPDVQEDYVDLTDEMLSKKIIQAKIKALYNTECVTACNYCDKGTELFIPVPAATQRKDL